MVRKIDSQMEFAKFPERTPLGKKAIEFLNYRDQIKKLEEETENIKTELIEEFKKSGFSKIRVEGQTISYSHTEKDKLVVKKKPGEI
jgi:hypothetical protein